MPTANTEKQIKQISTNFYKMLDKSYGNVMLNREDLYVILNHVKNDEGKMLNFKLLIEWSNAKDQVSKFNFLHDMFGVIQHFDFAELKMSNTFLPRCGFAK